ncbi:MAG: BrnA antitoxin family protein [Burkholderiales bacterium]|nr:BrnA antitoxin family protein [Burkholderiales bacterium]
MKISKKLNEELKALASLSDETIDYSDIPAVEDFSQFRHVSDSVLNEMVNNDLSWNEVVQILDTIESSKVKDQISLRLDHDIVQYFKSYGKKYQTRINDILRAFMIAEQRIRH